MKTCRTAVVGAGHFGTFHAEKLHASERAELVAVVDADAERAGAVAGRLGARALTDHRALIGSVDAVCVTVPTAAHYEVARFFLDNGVHVLVEKPFTATVEEADDLIARAHAGGLVLQVGHLERFFCAEIGLLQQVDRPVYIEALRIAPFRARGADVSVVLDLMIHDIDLIAALVGAPVRSVDAVGAPVLSDHEDIVNARLTFETGCVASVTASRIASKSERKVRIFQADCLYSVDLLERRIGRVRKTVDDGAPQLDVEERQFDKHDALRAEIDGFLRSVLDGEPPLVTGEDGRAALVTAKRVLASLAEHRALLAAAGPGAAASGDASGQTGSATA